MKIKINNPEIVLNGNFKNFIVKRKKINNRQELYVDNLLLNRNMEIDDANSEYCKRLQENGFNRSYAAITALLLREKVAKIELKKKYVKVYFEGTNNKITIDLTSPDLENNQEDLLNMIVGTYKKDRTQTIKKLINSDEEYSLCINGTASRSSFKIEEKKDYKLDLITSYRESYFGLNDQQFVFDLLKDLVTKENDVIEYEGYNMDGTISSSTYDLMRIKTSHGQILLDHVGYGVTNHMTTIINKHNEKINKPKELKKECKNNGTN